MGATRRVRQEVGEEDYKRAHFVLGEKTVCWPFAMLLRRRLQKRLERRCMKPNEGLSKEYEVSCEELDFLNDIAKENGVTGSRIMGGGFGGCTINLVKDDVYDKFIADAKAKYSIKYGKEPKVYEVIISDGSRKIC